MKRILTLSWVGLAVVAYSNAASFQVSLNTNLAQAQVTGTGAGNTVTSCAGAAQAATGYAGCVAGSDAAATGTSGAVSWTSTPTYSSNLFNSANSSNTSGNGNTGNISPGASYNVTDPSQGVVSLALGSTNSVWVGSGGVGGTTTLTIPVGIYAPVDAWTMLQDEFGVNGNSYTTVIFNFGSSSNGATVSSLTYSLTDGNQIRSSTVCTGTNTGGAAPSACTVFSGTTSSANTTQVFSQSYVGDGRTGPFTNTQGSVYLDAQLFTFGTAHTGDWLVSVQIQNTGGSYISNSTTNTSRTALSAITVDTAPEPSSVALFGAGLGSLAWFRRRRKA